MTEFLDSSAQNTNLIASLSSTIDKLTNFGFNLQMYNMSIFPSSLFSSQNTSVVSDVWINYLIVHDKL